MRKFLTILLMGLFCLTQMGFIGVMLGGGSSEDTVPPARSTGLQTNLTELTLFHNQWVAEGGTGPIDDDRDDLGGHATTARDSWAYDIQNTNWVTVSSRCVPSGVGDPTSTAYEIRRAATNIWAMALYGTLENINSAGTGDTYLAAARTRLLEFVLITDWTDSELSGANQCILDLASAVPHLLEAAWLLENGGYSGWTDADRQSLASWASNEVFYLESWSNQNRKNNWGYLAMGATVAIAAYAENVEGIDSVLEWNGINSGTILTPTQYLSASVPTRLNNLLDATDSANAFDSQCQTLELTPVFGIQSYGSSPDDLRRELPVNLENCTQLDLEFSCSTAESATITSGCGEAHTYQQKTTGAVARTCEMLRRIDGNGSRCFDLNLHSGPNQTLYDMTLFSTTQLQAPGGTHQGVFQDFYVDGSFQAFKYVASGYYREAPLYNATDEPISAGALVRGGYDYSYTRITHRDGVAHASLDAAQNFWGTGKWGESLWSEGDAALWDTNEWDAEAPVWAP